MNVTQWHGCYNDSWNGVITPDAFAHPAKYARGLIRRIYQHMLDSGYLATGDSVVDPFGGVALGGLDAMTFGLHWTGVELEPRFVELGQRNIEKWRRDLAMLNGTLGTARLLQGDSRRLLEVVGGGMGAAVSSPPYAESMGQGGESAIDITKTTTKQSWNNQHGQINISRQYGQTPGQLGSMRSGDFDAAISSPPYEGGTVHGDGNDKARHTAKGGAVGRWGSHATGEMAQGDYGSTPGQLGAMPSGDYAAAVSSPPYADAVNGTGEGPGARHDPIYHNGDNAHKVSSANGYGATPGNLGNLSGDGFQAAVSSPPFGGEAQHTGGPMPTKHYDGRQAPRVSSGMVTGAAPYGETEGQLAQENGDTFWAAARAIVEQTYAALRPGGYAAWVTKRFVRKGQIVEFSDQWEALCAAVGFQPVERIHAMLVEEHGTQLGLFGDEKVLKKERMSFFRRLAHKRGSPYIGHEDVIILRKPL